METTSFVIERTFNVHADVLWQVITDKEKMKLWYFDLKDFKPEVGFEFSFYGGSKEQQSLHICKITEVVPKKKLTYSWSYDGFPGMSYVTFELFAVGETTKLKLTHTNLETFPSDIKDFSKENFAAGWTYIIGQSLHGYVEKAQLKNTASE